MKPLEGARKGNGSLFRTSLPDEKFLRFELVAEIYQCGSGPSALMTINLGDFSLQCNFTCWARRVSGCSEPKTSLSLVWDFFINYLATLVRGDLARLSHG